MNNIASQITDNPTVCLAACSSLEQRKHQSSAVLALRGGVGVGCGMTERFPSQRPVMQNAVLSSPNGNIFRVTGPLWGESTGPRWIPLTKASNAGALMYSLICARTNGWVNNRDPGNLRCNFAHYEVTVMVSMLWYHHYYPFHRIAWYSGSSCESSITGGSHRSVIC